MKEYLSNHVIEYHQQENLEYIQFKHLLAYQDKLVHCYTLRSKEELNFPPIDKDEKTLKQSYQKVAKLFSLDDTQILKPHQTHTDHIAIVDKMESLEEIDGLLTNQKGLTLLTTSADCISLLFFDPIKEVIGSVHSGWKGTLQGISKKTVQKMIEEYHCNPQDIICAICPSIRQCCFEVETEVKELFEEKYAMLEGIHTIIQTGEIIEEKQKYKIDTVEINKRILKQMGLKQENILDSGICTKCHSKDFHSYRAEKEQSGRNAALVCLI